MLLICESRYHAWTLNTQPFNLQTQTIKLAVETFVIILFVCEQLLSTLCWYYKRLNETKCPAMILSHP